MKNQKHLFAIPVVIFLFISDLSAQCVNEANVTSFTYNNATYEVVQEGKTWVNAAACAVERGGYLIEINDVSEQNMIFPSLPFINFQNTTAPDGGGGGYLWIGGNDMATEGMWIWDGNNDSNGSQFWSGNASGSPVGGLYNNWGNEPDDYQGQDALAYAITNWPNGLQEEWNDADINNALYFIIEYPILGSEELKPTKLGLIYPNPSNETIQIDTKDVMLINMTDVNGRVVQAIETGGGVNVTVDISSFKSGLYFVNYMMSNGESISDRFVKK